MTDKEAIETLEKYFDKSCGNYRYQNKQKLDTEDAVWHAITMLREREERSKKPQTNADHIRSLSDEELAVFLCGVYDDDETNGKFINGYTICCYDEDGILDWLKQSFGGIEHEID